MKVASYLREHTQGLHRQTEALAYGEAIMEGALTADQYYDLIRRNEWLHRQLEPRFSQWLEQYQLTAFQPYLHFRLAALKYDLELLSLTPLSLPLLPPVLANGLQTIGGLYVLLGSHLGGRVIHKALRKNPRLQSITDFHYFADARQFPSREWPQFCRMLDEYSNTEEELKEILQGANTIFRFFHSVYDTTVVSP